MSKWEVVRRRSYYESDFGSIVAEICQFRSGRRYEWYTRFSTEGEIYDADYGICATIDAAKAACDASVRKGSAEFAKRVGIDEDEINLREASGDRS